MLFLYIEVWLICELLNSEQFREDKIFNRFFLKDKTRYHGENKKVAVYLTLKAFLPRGFLPKCRQAV